MSVRRTSSFTPAFPFVAQANDFDDVFACAAMLSGKKIEEVREIAVAKTKHPAPCLYYLGETQIAALPAQVGLIATVSQEVGRVGDRVLTTQRAKVIYHATLIEIAQQ